MKKNEAPQEIPKGWLKNGKSRISIKGDGTAYGVKVYIDDKQIGYIQSLKYEVDVKGKEMGRFTIERLAYKNLLDLGIDIPNVKITHVPVSIQYHLKMARIGLINKIKGWFK